MTEPYLTPDEPHPVTVVNEGSASPFFLTCDHGGRRIPRRLGRLGLAEADTLRHIAWDIGIAEIGGHLSRLIDATLVLQAYSRLVIDCNRDPRVPSSIPEISELTEIPGNRGLSEGERVARREAVFDPYHKAIGAALDRRRSAGRDTVLVALHSFTPVFKGASRPWHAGILYNRDARLARPLLALLRAEEGLVIGDNEPYAIGDLTDYTVPTHGEGRGLVHVEIEIRQDLIATPEGQGEWARRLARLLPLAFAQLRDCNS